MIYKGYNLLLAMFKGLAMYKTVAKIANCGRKKFRKSPLLWVFRGGGKNREKKSLFPARIKKASGRQNPSGRSRLRYLVLPSIEHY